MIQAKMQCLWYADQQSTMKYPQTISLKNMEHFLTRCTQNDFHFTKNVIFTSEFKSMILYK